jgi:lipoyl(octanoyl) transferase
VAELLVRELGTIPYLDALEIQERVRAQVQAGEQPDTLLLLEHPPVYTLGRRSAPGDLAMGEDWYRAQGFDVVTTDRGGKLTYHGPGQLVGYPIVHVDDVLAYVRSLERALAAALHDVGIEPRLRTDEGPDYTGVWVGERKIASIGVHVAKGVTTHGFAVNVDNDLRPFGLVVACGLPDVQMTSIREEGSAATLPEVSERAVTRLAEELGLTALRGQPPASSRRAPVLSGAGAGPVQSSQRRPS